MKILITGSNTSLNNGAMAIVVSTVETLRRFIPNSSFVILSNDPLHDRKRYATNNLKVVKREWQGDRVLPGGGIVCLIIVFMRCILWRIFHSIFGLNIRITLKGSLYEYSTCDICIDLSGDSLSEQYGVISVFYSLFDVLLGVVLKKKYVIYAQSIGPFTNLLVKFMVKFVLNKVSLITVREEVSKEYLQKLGVNIPPIHVTADPAFLLESSSTEEIDKILLSLGVSKNDNLLIGISPSQLIHRWASFGSRNILTNYSELMVEIVDYLVEKLHAIVILIPHVYAPDDDRIICKRIYKLIKNKNAVKLLMEQYKAKELKGVISQCDMFIGCRMHAVIASVSSHIPTIAIGYSHKALGIMKMLNQEEFVIDIRYLDFDTCLSRLISMIDNLWLNRQSVKEELRNRIKSMQERALLNVRFMIKSYGQ
ncbi:MAG: polysaccharide pyruvyl transferase family protein [Nitrososphaerales archaeon]